MKAMNLKIHCLIIAAFVLLTSAFGPAQAADLIIKVKGASPPLGRIGCSLFASAAGFPTDGTVARVIWQDADVDGVSCKFSDVGAGTYAVAVAHDVNGNQDIDTNFLGMPTEQWGVSNNIRPSRRPPSFEEAAFVVPETREGSDETPLVLTITVAR